MYYGRLIGDVRNLIMRTLFSLFVIAGIVLIYLKIGLEKTDPHLKLNDTDYDLFYFDGACCETLDERFIKMLKPVRDTRETQVSYIFVDLNYDLKTDLLVQFQNPLECGSGGCSSHFLLNEGDGQYKAIGNNHLYNSIYVAHKTHQGFRNLIMPTDDGRFCTHSWDGQRYQLKSCETMH